MEKLTQFLTSNALLVELFLSVVVLVLGSFTFKFRGLIIKAAEALKDGKISRAEAEGLADELLDSIYAEK
jgi:hypothetical protein